MNVVSGVYNCYVCGSFSPARYLEEFQSLSLNDAVRLVDDYRRELPSETKPDSGAFQAYDDFATYALPSASMTSFADSAAQALKPDLAIVQEYCASRGIPYDLLVELGWGYVPTSVTSSGQTQIEALSIPYRVRGEVVGIRGRAADGRKGGVSGSHLSLYNIDALKDAHECVLVEGESDCLRTIAALRAANPNRNLPVLAVPGVTFRREWVREFRKVQRVYVIPQADHAAWDRFLPTVTKALGQSRVFVVRLQWEPGEQGKDVCDWLRTRTDDALARLLPEIPNPLVRKPVLSIGDMRTLSQLPVDWVATDLIARGDKVVIGGPQKAMKTFLALNIARSLVCGDPVLGIWSVPKPCRVLFVEEEGTSQAFSKRVTRIFPPDLQDSEELFFGMVRQSVKLDSDTYEILHARVDELRPDVLMLDPFQRLHSLDEDLAAEIGVVWDRLNELVTYYPQLSIVLIHHFAKGRGVDLGWDAFRGSSRIGGESDVGLFVQRKKDLDPLGRPQLDLVIDGRDITQDKQTVIVDVTTFEMTVAGAIVLSTTQDAQTVTNALFTSPNGLSFSDLATATGLPTWTLREALRGLRSAGKVRLDGSGRGARWSAVPEP